MTRDIIIFMCGLWGGSIATAVILTFFAGARGPVSHFGDGVRDTPLQVKP